MTHFETTVEIARRREEVFAYVADPSRLAEWNSAVERVTPLAGGAPGRDARHLMQRRLPTGPATNELAVVARPPHELLIRTLTGPTPFVYRYAFTETHASTRITVHCDVTLAGAAAVLGPLAAAAVKRGVDANLGTLRALLERGA
jgi:uncharacterized protein YndB with AHSA1/START domain